MDFAIPSYKKKPTLAVEHVIAKKKRPSSCHPLQTSSSQGSISQPVLSEIKGWELFLKNAIRL